MDNVVDIEWLFPYKVSEVICINCKKRWVSVRPFIVLLKDIECPNCGQGFVIETGEILNKETM